MRPLPTLVLPVTLALTGALLSGCSNDGGAERVPDGRNPTPLPASTPTGLDTDPPVLPTSGSATAPSS